MAILPVGIGPQEGGYQIERSLRFNSADSAKLTRTPASAGNRKTWTFSAWVKRSALGSAQGIFHCYDGSSSRRASIQFNSDNTIGWDQGGDGSSGLIDTVAVYRDVSAWYHLVCVADYSNGTAANRAKIYINNVLQTVTTTDDFENADGLINSTNQHQIGSVDTVSYLNSYLTEIHFIDGSALDPTSFGEYNTDTGVWQPKAYTGSYGTNGFYLDFADNSSTTALGYDAAGSNDWTPNNFSVTAGAGNDSLVDTPTPYGTDTGAGGEVRGNYATLNALVKPASVTLSNGNLDVTLSTSSGNRSIGSTFYQSTGSWYWETVATTVGNNSAGIGIANDSFVFGNEGGTGCYFYLSDGRKVINNVYSTYGASYVANDVIGIAFDATNGTITFYKNNSSQGQITGIPTGVLYTPFVCSNTSITASVFVTNFGQRPFAYTAPSGFKALCTQNLPEPTVKDGGDYFAATTYTGTGAAQSISNSGGFQPDLIWIKNRTDVANNQLWDAVRGNSLRLVSNTTDAETSTTVFTFDTDGFDLTGAGSNTTGKAYIAWQWKAGGSGVSNTAGTITSTVSANTTAGFSIITYTGNGTGGATVGHGLGVAPQLIIVKRRATSASSWLVYHASMATTPQNNYLSLNLTDAVAASSLPWNNTAPTSTVITLGTSGGTNNSSDTYVAYAFAPIAGYSAFGSYTGNGSTDGPFVYTGFRPRWIMLKCSSVSGSGWAIMDTSRVGYNVSNNDLYADLSNAEATSNYLDILSNGFKFRSAAGDVNGSTRTYIYAAFSENPFKYSLGR